MEEGRRETREKEEALIKEVIEDVVLLTHNRKDKLEKLVLKIVRRSSLQSFFTILYIFFSILCIVFFFFFMYVSVWCACVCACVCLECVDRARHL